VPKRIFDISKKLGLHPKEVLVKARELGITQAKVPSSQIDDTDAERLEEELKELIKANPSLVTKLTPKLTLARIDTNDFVTIANFFKNSATFLPPPPQMKPCMKNRKLVQAHAELSWAAALKHRVYSCPDTPTYDFVLGATVLLLYANKRRVLLSVEAVQTCNLRAPNFLESVPTKFRARFSNYLNEVQNIPHIVDGNCNYRFYFLTTEPWPLCMQELAASASATEWSAILSICTDSDDFFRWPQVGELLWPGCVRSENNGEYNFPTEILTRLSQFGLKPDTRTNGPAINSYLVAGGARPTWGGEGWHIHHIYDGTEGSPHAVKDGSLFTHSAGLVAAHPVAHHFAHQSNLLKSLLWREAFLRFGFDPMGVFVGG
jgi:hypothetical protein